MRVAVLALALLACCAGSQAAANGRARRLRGIGAGMRSGRRRKLLCCAGCGSGHACQRSGVSLAAVPMLLLLLLAARSAALRVSNVSEETTACRCATPTASTAVGRLFYLSLELVPCFCLHRYQRQGVWAVLQSQLRGRTVQKRLRLWLPGQLSVLRQLPLRAVSRILLRSFWWVLLQLSDVSSKPIFAGMLRDERRVVPLLRRRIELSLRQRCRHRLSLQCRLYRTKRRPVLTVQFRHIQGIPGLSGMHELRKRCMSWWPLSQQLRWHERGKLLGMYTMCSGAAPKRLWGDVSRLVSGVLIGDLQDVVRV